MSLKLLCCIADNYRPPSEGWGKVIVSLCSHLGGGVPSVQDWSPCAGLKEFFYQTLGKSTFPEFHGGWGLYKEQLTGRELSSSLDTIEVRSKLHAGIGHMAWNPPGWDPPSWDTPPAGTPPSWNPPGLGPPQLGPSLAGTPLAWTPPSKVGLGPPPSKVGFGPPLLGSREAEIMEK